MELERKIEQNSYIQVHNLTSINKIWPKGLLQKGLQKETLRNKILLQDKNYLK